MRSVEIDAKRSGADSGVPARNARRHRASIRFSARDILELHGAAKVPHKNRELLARVFGLRHDGPAPHEYHVGGGFGVRGEIYPED